ncbi:MAG: hypothetical protein C0505_18020 [Leptothrix sp. (in: Bacteria)]|nr:hypothetical protein [Leptothrix sp. (in: b-proteobacteria)]
MKTKFAVPALFIASAMFVASPAFAELTREQVKAEFAEAVRTGDIMSNKSGQKLNERFPDRYAAKQVQSTLTREQVKAELAEALRTGNYVMAGEESGLCKDVHPYMHTVQ